MKIIGGEYECEKRGSYSYLTDLGRSSLRIILRSLPSKARYFLPDFLCDTILKIFEKEGRQFDFYHINKNLSIDKSSLKRLGRRGIFYVIDYFGQRDALLSKLVDNDMSIIEDCVFLPAVENVYGAKRWVGFNSFRKISCIGDGSMIKSTMKLEEALIGAGEAPFSKWKYLAKNIKYDYLHKSLFSEKKYLAISDKAKKLINSQKRIYSPSGKSLADIFDFYGDITTENNKRRKNYLALKRLLRSKLFNIRAPFLSYCPLFVKDRDKLREYLFQKKVFLPVHWPNAYQLKNSLYDNLISIPLDSRYDEKDMRMVGNLINGFVKQKA